MFDQYQYAIVRYVTFLPKTKNEIELFFASIELLHADRACPVSQPLMDYGNKKLPDNIEVKGPIKGSLGFRRIAMKSSDAISWYRSLMKGNAKVPFPLEEDLIDGKDGEPILTKEFLQEPKWPELSTPITAESLFGNDDSDFPCPYLGRGMHPVQLHRLLPSDDHYLAPITYSKEVCEWLSYRVHFDVSEYSELVGSVALVVPNNDIKSINVQLARNKNGQEHFVSEVIPRAAGRLDGYELTVFEKRYGALGFMKTNKIVTSHFHIDPAPQELEETGYYLYRHSMGLIDYQPPAPFLRAITTSISKISQRYTFEASDGLHTVESRDKESQFTTTFQEQGQKLQTFRSKMALAKNNRLRRKKAKDQGQYWFFDRDKARKFLRETISKTREEILVVDPYLNGQQLVDFLTFVQTDRLKINVLTSLASAVSHGDDAQLSRKQYLIEDMNRAGSLFMERGISLDVRVMAGGRNSPVVHDRFLLIDNSVWFLGNSLNQIGERASVLVRLPDPLTVEQKLGKIFEDSESIYLSESAPKGTSN